MVVDRAPVVFTVTQEGELDIQETEQLLEEDSKIVLEEASNSATNIPGQTVNETMTSEFIALDRVVAWYRDQGNQADISSEVSNTVNRLFPQEEFEREWETEELVKERIETDMEIWLEAEFSSVNVVRVSIVSV